MGSECIYDKLNQAVRRNEAAEVGKILKSAVVDFGRISGDEGNIINVAIENADVEVLAKLLGVDFPLKQKTIPLSYEKYSLLTSSCDSTGLTPLMKATTLGKYNMVTLLLSYGSEVNYARPGGKAAIDLSRDPEMVLALFQHDSIFPRLRSDSQIQEFRSFISSNEKLREIFQSRDEIHDSMKKGEFNSDIKAAFELGKWVYHVNSEGHSALFTAGINKNYDAWAYLMDHGMQYANQTEAVEVKEVQSYNEEMCDRALERLFFPIKGCHVMKLVSKSTVFGSTRNVLDLSSRVVGFFQYLDEDEITSALMQVLQDVPGLRIAFDFDTAGIERMRAACSKGDRGITDFEKVRICVGVKEMDDFGFPEIVSNLAHEMCHMVMWVVFKNWGLPYSEGDTVKETEYNKVKEDVLDALRVQKCDKIIRKVKKYPESVHGHELIVRVPEIIAKYLRSEIDGFELLKSQAPELLDYYEQYVQPECEDYIDGSFTNNRITGRGLMEYQKLLTVYQKDWIQVCEGIDRDIKNFTGQHNGIMVIKASNVKLAHSHLSLSFQRDDKVAPLFVDWSLYLNCQDLLMKGLKSREIEKLAISWDVKSAPKFCDRRTCSKETCPGHTLRDFKACIIFLIGSEWSVLKGVKPIEYVWCDLSPETKQVIQNRKVNFGGKLVMLKELICPHEKEGVLENFMKENLDSSDLALLLEEENVGFGKPNSWMSGREDNILLKHPGCFISRTLIQKYVEFNDDTLRRNGNDVFFVSNVDVGYLCQLGIREKYISQWDPKKCDGHVPCYIFDPKTDERDEEVVLQEIIRHLHYVSHVQMIHYLKSRQGVIALIKSYKNGRNVNNEMEVSEDLLSSRTVENLLETSTFKAADVVVIADDPGTGKSVYLNFLAKEIKKCHPKKWVSLIDLSLQEQQNHLVNWAKSSLSGNEMVDLLFQMVKCGSCELEGKVFQDYCQRENDVVIIFDGFDEICPKYKSTVTSFLVGLKKSRSNIKLFVSTRLHEKFDLEEALCAVSYQLIPFSEDDQITFLNEYWNALLKNLPFEEGQEKIESFIASIGKWDVEENDEVIFNFIQEMKEALSTPKRKYRRLNFTPVAKRVLLGQDTFEGLERFTEIPLHAQMVATIIFEDSFNVRRTMNLGHLYQRFYDLKMKIFGREKARHSGNVQADNLVRMGQKRATKTLEEFSANLMLDEKLYVFKSGDIGDVISVGLLSIKDGNHQFVHRTFAEFFFARWLLIEAGKDHVTKLWLQRVFVDDGFARVRDFLEDLLPMLTEGVVALEEAEDVLMLEKADMTSSPLNDYKLVNDLNISIYAVILHSEGQILQYFVDSFGNRATEVLFKDLDCKKWNFTQGSAMEIAIKRYLEFEWTRNKFGNAFSFAAHCIARETKLPPSSYMKVVRKMLLLVEKFNLLEEMHKVVSEKGLKWLFPNYFQDGDGSLTYNAEIVNFLIEHKEIFRGVLRRGFSSSPETIFLQMSRNNFNILSSMASAVLDESECGQMLTEKGIFFQVWVSSVNIYGLSRMKEVWNFIKTRLVDEKHQLNYLVWRDDDEINALVHTAYYENPEVIEFVWNLAGDLMDAQERKLWLLESFGSGDISSPIQYLDWGFHKFLSNLVNEGYLSGDELFDLLMSKDDVGQCYILRDYPYGLFTAVLPLNHHLSSECFVKVMDEMECFYYGKLWLYLKASESVNVDLREIVEQIFEEVKSCDRYSLTDPLYVDENGLLIDLYGKFRRRIREDRFKYFVAIFHKQVELDKENVGREELLIRLKRPEILPPQYEPNMLHHVVYYKNSLPLGYICSVLVHFLPAEDMLELLFQLDKQGNSVFHISTEEMFCDSWGKFYDVARALLGEDALWRVHSHANSRGFCVQDLFLQEEMKVERE